VRDVTTLPHRIRQHTAAADAMVIVGIEGDDFDAGAAPRRGTD
jgi:hypothetical protein